MDSRRGKAQNDVALGGARAVDEVGPIDEADDRPAEVDLLVAVDPGQLSRLAAEDRASRRAAHLGRPLDELDDLLRLDRARSDVVEEEERLGARGEDVVDAVRGEVGAAPAKPTRAPAEDELRADGVGRGGEQAPLVDRVETGERAERADHGVRPGRVDGRAKAVDDGLGRRERDPCGCVRLVVRRHGASVVDPPAGCPGLP